MSLSTALSLCSSVLKNTPSECMVLFIFNQCIFMILKEKKTTRMHIPLTGKMYNIPKTPHYQLCRQAHETLLYGTRVFVPEKNSWSWMEE